MPSQCACWLPGCLAVPSPGSLHGLRTPPSLCCPKMEDPIKLVALDALLVGAMGDSEQCAAVGDGMLVNCACITGAVGTPRAVPSCSHDWRSCWPALQGGRGCGAAPRGGGAGPAHQAAGRWAHRQRRGASGVGGEGQRVRVSRRGMLKRAVCCVARLRCDDVKHTQLLAPYPNWRLWATIQLTQWLARPITQRMQGRRGGCSTGRAEPPCHSACVANPPDPKLCSASSRTGEQLDFMEQGGGGQGRGDSQSPLQHADLAHRLAERKQKRKTEPGSHQSL